MQGINGSLRKKKVSTAIQVQIIERAFDKTSTKFHDEATISVHGLPRLTAWGPHRRVGGVMGTENIAGAGGVICDYCGLWRMGFLCHMGKTSVLAAKLCALRQRAQLVVFRSLPCVD